MPGLWTTDVSLHESCIDELSRVLITQLYARSGSTPVCAAVHAMGRAGNWNEQAEERQRTSHMMRSEETPAAVQTAACWMERCGRIGYVAKGTLYIVIGILALHTAVAIPTQLPTTENALAAILVQPFGGLLLSSVTLGLFGYAGWQLVAAVVDGEHDGSHAIGRLVRLGKGWGSLVYTALAVQSARIVTGRFVGGEQAEAWTAIVLGFAPGRVLVGLTGVGIVCLGLYQFYQVYAWSVRHQLDLSTLRHRIGTLMRWLGRFGLVARGVVFGLIGVLLVRAAIHYDPYEASGLGEAFLILERLPFGPWLLGSVALGFIAYGLAECFIGYYRQLDAQ